MRHLASRLSLAAALLATAILVAPEHGVAVPLNAAAEGSAKGPPWISIEYPANPHDPASRGAFLVVNTFRHGTPTSFPVTGRAEGDVDGQRKSQKLELRATSRPGVYALHRQWPEQGTWVLVLSTHGSPGDGATALVSLARDGSVASVEVPSREQDGWTVPRAVSDAEIEALLARRVAAR